MNTTIDGAYVFSSGKNMGVFKAVGYPEDVGRFYRLEEYEGFCFDGFRGVGINEKELAILGIKHAGE